MEWPSWSTKESKMQYLMQSQKWQKDLCLFPRQAIHYHGNPSLCPKQKYWISWSWMILWRWTRPSRTNTQKRCPFHHRGLKSKSKKSRDTGITGKFGLGVQNEPGQRLTEFCQENALVLANTLFQERKRQLYTWTWPDGQYRNQIDDILCSQRWRSSIQSA